MNRSKRLGAGGVVALVLLGAGAAGAQTPAPSPPSEVRAPEPTASPEARGTGGPSRMRTSHTVDVIAPGEKVDTILGRMRPERPVPSPREDAVRPPPGREGRGGPPPPGGGVRTEQSRPLDTGRDNGREGGRPPPHTSPRTDGVAPPPSGPRPSPPR